MEAQRIALEQMCTQVEAQHATIAKIGNKASSARDEYTRLVNEEGGVGRGSAPADNNVWDPKTCNDIEAAARHFLAPERAAELLSMLVQLGEAAAAAGAATTAPAAATPATRPVPEPQGHTAAAPAAQLPEGASAGKREQVRAPADTPVEAGDARLGAAQRGRTLVPGHERDGGDKPRSASRSPHGAPRVDNDGADDLG